jgi:Carboxypeptidase regulatory-like domain
MRFVALLFCVFILSLAAFGQGANGTITGTVTDPAGAVIANAPIQAKNAGTGVVYPAATSGTGNYTLSELPIGTYEISVTAPGFKKETRTGVEVAAQTTFRVDFALQVGAATESVTITAEAPLLKTESGELAHNVTTETLDNLPILTIGSDGAGVRNPLAAILLLPGASFTSDAVLRINGLPSSSQSIRIEGQDATNGFWKEINSQSQAGVEAIQEVAVQTSNFAPEYGQAGGGYINYTMKSGTNQYHGSAFSYDANDALNAGTPFTNAGATNSLKDGQLIRNSLRRFDFGGTFGGPIRIPKVYNGTDRTFFFFSYEQYIQKTLTTGTPATVPTAAYQQGNFSAAELTTQVALNGVAQVDALGNKLFGNEIFDPATQQTVNGQTVRTPFPNNTIPVTRFDPSFVIAQSLLPQPTNANLVNNYIVPSYFNFTHTELPTLKLDHNVSSTQKVSVYYNATRIYSPAANGYTQAFSGAEPTNDLAQTTRVNYDQSITPTLLMHVGAGLLQQTVYTLPSAQYNQSQIFGNNVFYLPNQFPDLFGFSDPTKGGSSVGMGVGFSALFQKDTQPTFVNSFTWVKGNHTFKFGGEALFQGLPIANGSRSDGEFGFGQAETGDPYITPLTTTGGSTGFGYASFALGLYNSLAVSPQDTLKLGNHTFGLYAQDSWKVTRRLTLDYGLRYDFATLLSEQHGRMQDAAFNLPDPAIGGRIGTVIYGGNCKCQLNGNYPYALGPRLGLAYKLGDKTVIRLGSGISYGTSPNNAFLSYSVPDFYTYSDQPAAGIPAGEPFHYGNPFAPGNPFGNATLKWPNFTPLYPFQTAPGYAPPESPFISIDRNGGRLPRIMQWSLGAQRELTRGLVVEAYYVGNRGAWFTAPLLSISGYNSLTPAMVQAAGLNPTSASDLSLLTTPIASGNGTINPTIAQRFPWLQVVNTPGGLPTIPAVYPGFPATQQLGQALRPQPQWDGVPPFLGPPLGTTWYDSLQSKITKRFSHGLTANYAFTWQKELVSGTSSDTSYLVPSDPRINDVFNYGQNKQLSGYSRPLVSIISFSYQTPRVPGDSKGMKALSWVTKDWVWNSYLRYQSGAVIPTADSNNNFLTELQRGGANNPALWGGGTTFQNLVPGQPLFLVNPNSKFDPTTTLVLNPAAWSDVSPGQFGTAPAYLNNYRWQRQPTENMGFGRIFPVSKESNKRTLQIRIEFTNVFNRLYYSLPSNTNPEAVVLKTNPFFTGGPTGALSSGFGFVNSVNGAGATPRAGQIVARFQF